MDFKKVDFYPLISIIKKFDKIITEWNAKMRFSKGDILVCVNKINTSIFLRKLKKLLVFSIN